MARIPKHLLNRPITPGWVITAEALAVALLVHAALFALAGYRPEKPAAVTPKSPGVSLLTRAEFSGNEWKLFSNWLRVHDPSQISRADSPSGYTALLGGFRVRAVEALREPALRREPAPASLPDYVSLPVATTQTAGEPALFSGGTLTESEFRAPAPVLKPVVYDGDGKPVRLDRLSVPAAAKPAERPTVVKVWGKPGFMRQHLAESSGVAALDLAAMQAVAAGMSGAPRTIVVYWPETVPGKAPEEEEP